MSRLLFRTESGRDPAGGRRRGSRRFTPGSLRGPETLEDRALLSTVTVHVENNVFSPNSVTINPGDTVHWVWDEGVHSTTSDPGQSESWDSGLNSPPFTFDHTFTHVGTFTYFCKIHTGMTGTITVNSTSPLQAIAVTPANPSIPAGTSQQFTAIGVYGDHTTRNLTSQVAWASANTSVATISSTGKATGQAQGTSKITASLSGISGSTNLTVTSAPAPTLTGVQRITTGHGRRRKPIGFELDFSTALNAAVAQDTSHYQVVQPGRGRKGKPKPVAVLAAQYDASKDAVRLTLGKFAANRPLTLTATGLVGATGTPAGTIVTPL